MELIFTLADDKTEVVVIVPAHFPTPVRKLRAPYLSPFILHA